MFETTLTPNGQTTIPARLREQLGAKAGTRLVWHALPGGSLLVRAKTLSILDMAGRLKAPKGRHVSVAAMNAWR